MVHAGVLTPLYVLYRDWGGVVFETSVYLSEGKDPLLGAHHAALHHEEVVLNLPVASETALENKRNNKKYIILRPSWKQDGSSQEPRIKNRAEMVLLLLSKLVSS